MSVINPDCYLIGQTLEKQEPIYSNAAAVNALSAANAKRNSDRKSTNSTKQQKPHHSTRSLQDSSDSISIHSGGSIRGNILVSGTGCKHKQKKSKSAHGEHAKTMTDVGHAMKTRRASQESRSHSQERPDVLRPSGKHGRNLSMDRNSETDSTAVDMATDSKPDMISIVEKLE